MYEVHIWCFLQLPLCLSLEFQVNTLQNWLSEFNMWVPPAEALPADVDPSVLTPRGFKVHILNDEHK